MIEKYNFLTREVYMPKKHFIKDRHKKLSKTENIFFAVLWFSKGHLATYKELFSRVYGYKKIEKRLLRGMANKLRRKGINIVPVYKFGYQLKD